MTGYTYNLGGALIEETYPSGRVVKNVLDANGDLARVESKKTSSAGYWRYADNFTYNPAGAVTSLQLGNGHWESTTFNSRLQPTQIALGVTPNTPNVLKLDYTYGSSANNGNVLSQTITVPGMSYPLVQSYTYDPLNRLESAVETSNSAQTWKQEFSYDRYGNRSFVIGSGHTDTLGSCTTMCNPTFSSTTNRITSSGYTFDNAGNTTADPASRTFVYDAENKQTSVSDPGGTAGEYSYDGDGKRVKKYVPATGEVTIFVYDTVGKSVAEYSTIVETTNAQVAYLTADTLGTPRINTDANGAVIARHDYMPFGEAIATAQRTTGYSGDGVKKKFTGYERDDETGLDFAQARMCSSALGRFGIPDPENAGADSSSPQSWNGYAYVANNPLNLVDPSGLAYVRKGDTIYWVDDQQWDDCQKDAKCRARNKDYEYLPYGTRITVAGDENGEFYALKGQTITLERGRKLVPVQQSGYEPSLIQQMLWGAENRTLWFWRPAIYIASPAAMLPAATPIMAFGAGSAAGGGILGLGLSSTAEIPSGLALSPTLMQVALQRGTFNPNIYAQLEKDFAARGVSAIYNGLLSTAGTIGVHLAKLEGAQYRSSMERTVQNGYNYIVTALQFLKDKAQ